MGSHFNRYAQLLNSQATTLNKSLKSKKMKTSNKILLGTVGLIVLCMLSTLIYMRANLRIQSIQNDTSEWQTQIRNIGSFNVIEVHTAADVYLSQGETKFEMKGTEDMMANIEVLVEGGKLIVKNKNDNSLGRGSNKVLLYIKTDSLTYLQHSGVGSIESSSILTYPNWKINTSGTNDASLEIRCNDFNYHQSGFGSVSIEGMAEHVGYSNSGAGSMDGSNLEAKNVDVNGSGAGSFYVYATEQLNINLSGAGSVNYKGNPRIQQHVSGFGSVSAM